MSDDALSLNEVYSRTRVLSVFSEYVSLRTCISSTRVLTTAEMTTGGVLNSRIAEAVMPGLHFRFASRTTFALPAPQTIGASLPWLSQVGTNRDSEESKPVGPSLRRLLPSRLKSSMRESSPNNALSVP